MSLLVLKFGGTSVADVERIRNVAAHVKREVDAGHACAVVVSAMAGQTNQLVAWVEKAARLNESGTPVARPRKHPKPAIPLPAELVAAFRTRKHARAKAFYESLSPSGRREYLEWITGAKRAETRARRVAKTLEQLADGKPLNWKYAK